MLEIAQSDEKILKSIVVYHQCFTKLDIFLETDLNRANKSSSNNNNNGEKQQMNATNFKHKFVVAFDVDELATIFFLFLSETKYTCLQYVYDFILLRIEL